MHPEKQNEDNDDISKSQRKRDMHTLQALGQQLVELPKEQFEKITLEEVLYDAILAARRIHQHGARKRQLQYIGKLMRGLDAEPIQEQLDTLMGHSKRAAQTLHHLERWRDRLLEEGDGALTELLNEHSQADRQYLRQLIRNAQKESHANKPPKSARTLFKYLRELTEPVSEN
ncbi:MAG: ribosome-associated protein [Gammaproteobacteria bacterium]|nr:ribosome-associated protein [Gammaproteobacteria bacterium]